MATLPSRDSAYMQQALDELTGSAGLATYPSGAAAANGVSVAEVARFIQEAIVDGAAFSQTVDPGGSARASVELVLADLAAMLAGSAGITTFPNAAIPANSVSLAEVIRQLYAALEGTAAGQNGVATWPTAAAYANNVSIAEVLAYVQDAVRNGSGTAMATNKSVADAIGATGSAYLDVSGSLYYDSLSQPRCVAKTDGAVLNGNDDIFTVASGPVVAQIYGLVTTVIGGAANGRLKHTTTAPAATIDLNAGAVAVDSDAVGTVYTNEGATSVFTPSSGLGFKLIDPVTIEGTWFFLSPGTTHFNGSAAQSGVIAWYMRYIPLSPASRVTAAA